MASLTGFEIRDNLREAYSDVYTPMVLEALAALAPLNRDVREVMAARLERRRRRARNRERITFLDPSSVIPRTKLTVQEARDGAEGLQVTRGRSTPRRLLGTKWVVRRCRGS